MDQSDQDLLLKRSSSAPHIAGNGEDDAFDSIEEELQFYKARASELEVLKESAVTELDEHLILSKDMEEELQAEITRAEDKTEEYREKVVGLMEEIEGLKEKHQSLQRLYNSSSDQMQRELDNVRSERDAAQKAVVYLEQGNDELERGERNALSRCLEVEGKYNRLVEEKALLEQDLLGKDALQEEVQRLKDELRDQSEEIDNLRHQQTLHEQALAAARSLNNQNNLSSHSTPTTPSQAEFAVFDRAQFMSPVVEASFEGTPSSSSSIIGTPTPAPTLPVSQSISRLAQKNNATSGLGSGPDGTSGGGGFGTPARIPVRSVSRSRLEPTSKPSTPPVGLSKSRTSMDFSHGGSSSPSIPKYGLSASTNLSRSTTSKNIAGLVAGSSGFPASPSPLKQQINANSPSYPRYRVQPSGLGASTTSVRSVTGESSTTSRSAGGKLLNESRARLGYLRTRLANAVTEKPKRPAGSVPKPETMAAHAHTLGASTSGSTTKALSQASKRHSAMPDMRSGGMTRVAALLAEQDLKKSQRNGVVKGMDGVAEESFDGSPNSWVVVKEEEGDTAGGGAQQEEDLTKVSWDQVETASALSRSSSTTGTNKSLPTRPGIPSPLTTTRTLNQSTNFRSGSNTNTRPTSRISTDQSHTTATATSSSGFSDEIIRPVTPSSPAKGSRIPVSSSSRPGSSLGHRPESSSGYSRPESSTGYRPGSAMSFRGRDDDRVARAMGISTSISASSSGKTIRPSNYRGDGSPGVIPFPGGGSSTTSSSRAPSRSSSTYGFSSPTLSSYGPNPPTARGIPRSPSMLSASTATPAASSADAAAMKRSARRVSLTASQSGITSPESSGGRSSGIPRRSLSGRPPSAILQSKDVPPLPPMSPEHKNLAQKKRQTMMAMGVSSPIKEW